MPVFNAEDVGAFYIYVAKCPFPRQGAFSNKKNIGFVDTTGRLVIKPRYDVAYDFSEGLAAVKVGEKEGRRVSTCGGLRGDEPLGLT